MAMPKVYSYIRFSSKAQATGDSLRRQTANTARWATRHGYELDDALTYRDLGVSAFDRTNLRSGALGLFLRSAQEGKIERGSILAIEALDRLTRAEPLDAFRLLSDLVSCGISIVTVSDERIYDESSLNGDFASLMLAAALLVRGHEESKRKSERIKDGYSARRDSKAKRIASVAPHWIRPEGDGWGLIPEHAQTVLEIFQLSAQGIGATRIARHLNDLKRPLIYNGTSPTAGWYSGRVASLLRNRVVIGEYQPQTLGKDGKRELAGDPIPDHYPAAVPKDLFWNVQAQMNERTTSGRGHRRDVGYCNILQGLLYCGYCGGRMTLEKKGLHLTATKSAAFYSYGCSAAIRHVTSCDNRINYKALLFGAPERTHSLYPRNERRSFLSGLFEHLLAAGEQISDAADQQQAQAYQQYEGANAQWADAEARKAKLIDALESGVLSLAEIQPRLDRIRGEMAQWEIQRDAARVAMKGPDTQDNVWLIDAVESHMADVISILTDDRRVDERAALRTRLLQRVEAIYLYRQCARVKLRHREFPLTIALEPGVDVAMAETVYPLPAVAAKHGGKLAGVNSVTT